VDRSKLQCGDSLDIHDSANQMKDKRSKTRGMHLVGVRDTLVILSYNGQVRDEHGNTCVH
jgi:hypothetical protein